VEKNRRAREKKKTECNAECAKNAEKKGGKWRGIQGLKRGEESGREKKGPNEPTGGRIATCVARVYNAE
jgi:hypothetical protein